MTESEESAYALGQRAVWHRLLDDCLRQLGVDDPVAGQARWVSEREDVIAALRLLCGEVGDNDWSDDAHLGDVISKHLGDHLLR